MQNLLILNEAILFKDLERDNLLVLDIFSEVDPSEGSLADRLYHLIVFKTPFTAPPAAAVLN